MSWVRLVCASPSWPIWKASPTDVRLFILTVTQSHGEDTQWVAEAWALEFFGGADLCINAVSHSFYLMWLSGNKKIPPSGIGTSSAYGLSDFQYFNKDGLMSKCYQNVSEMRRSYVGVRAEDHRSIYIWKMFKREVITVFHLYLLKAGKSTCLLPCCPS